MCCDKVGMVYRRALFVKRPSPNYGKNSSNKQRDTTVHHYYKRHEGQSIWKISRTLKVSSSAVTKTIKRNDETLSHEDRHRKGRPRFTSAAEDRFINVTNLRNCSPNKFFIEFKKTRHISTSTLQRRLCESVLHG